MTGDQRSSHSSMCVGTVHIAAYRVVDDGLLGVAVGCYGMWHCGHLPVSLWTALLRPSFSRYLYMPSLDVRRRSFEALCPCCVL